MNPPRETQDRNLFDLPPLLADLMASISAPSGPSLSPPANAFSVSLDFAAAGLERRTCSCCRPPVPVTSSARHLCQSLLVHGDPSEVGMVDDDHVPRALERVFGRDGLAAIFGCSGAAGARRLQARGMNHLFMVALGGRLAKCVSPRAECFSEAQEAERLRHESPSLASDEHAIFPLASFLCRPAHPVRGQALFEVVVFEFLDGCRSVGDLVRMFERTHPFGDLQSASACQRHRACGSCEHATDLRHLVVNQVSHLGLRFQAVHGRRHGDFKVDNVLLDRHGLPRLVDFLSPFCSSCDREELRNSMISTNPAIQDMRYAFDSSWQSAQHRGELASHWRKGGRVLDPADLSRNALLVASLERLAAVSESHSIFGPVPSLLGNIGLTIPGFSVSVPNLAGGARGGSGFGDEAGGAAAASPLGCMLMHSGPQDPPAFGWAHLPPTALPSPTRGLRCPALPTVAFMDRDTPSSRGLSASPIGTSFSSWPPMAPDQTPTACASSGSTSSGPRLSLPANWRAAPAMGGLGGSVALLPAPAGSPTAASSTPSPWRSLAYGTGPLGSQDFH